MERTTIVEFYTQLKVSFKSEGQMRTFSKEPSLSVAWNNH